MRRKGQTLVFEQVLLFGMGVAIFVICFAVFTIYQDFFLSVGGENQHDQVVNLVSTAILKLAEKDQSSNLVSSVTIPIPKAIKNEPYVIRLSSAGLGVVQSGGSGAVKTSTLFYLNQSLTMVQGEVASVQGKITVKIERTVAPVQNKILIS